MNDTNREMDRFYDLLQEQSRTLTEQGKALAAIGQSIAGTHERLFGTGNTPGAIPHLYAEVEKHGKQINMWRGALAVMTLIWGALMTWGGIVLSRRH